MSLDEIKRLEEIRKMTMADALDFLGAEFFFDALNASGKELERWIDHSESILSGASQAYERVKLFRQDCGEELA